MTSSSTKRPQGLLASLRGLPRRLHRDEDGAITLVSVFAFMLLTMLLGMVMNVGRQVDGKIRMQNAADSASWSGGLVIARGLNTLAFSNHLMCDVFALTAFMREARDRNGEPYAPEILAAWADMAPDFAKAPPDPHRERIAPPFRALEGAIIRKLPKEQQLVLAFSNWAASASEAILPLLEDILRYEMIPEYQRAVVGAIPDVAQQATMEIARRNGEPDFGRGEMLGVLWRTNVTPVAGGGSPIDRVLPVVDPVLESGAAGADYVEKARGFRKQHAETYLDHWNNEALAVFDLYAKMCGFGHPVRHYYERRGSRGLGLWRGFTCGQLRRLLEEYPYSNLPHMLRTQADSLPPHPDGGRDGTAHLDTDFSFVGAVYWKPVPQMMPGVYRQPLEGDCLAYAQVRVFVPRLRLVWVWDHYGASDRANLGGVPGDIQWIPKPGDPDPDTGSGEYDVKYEPNRSSAWSLFNQRWTVQLVPATHERLAEILQARPPTSAEDGTGFEPPNLGGLATQDIVRISPH